MKHKRLCLISLLPAITYGNDYKTHTSLNNCLSIQINDGIPDIIPLTKKETEYGDQNTLNEL